jgi:hypothetical protein
MSQSDYIKFKKTKNILNDLKRFPSVLESQDYTDFIQYGIETSVIGNTYLKPQFNQLIPITDTTVFNMKVNTNCPTLGNLINSFKTCQNTNGRSNRVLNGFNPLNPHSFSFTLENTHKT